MTEHEPCKNTLFADIEPWDEAVNGSDLLNDVLAVLQTHVIADVETLHAASLWVCMTWLTDYATVLPLAMITAPEKNCGKTTLLSAMSKMSFRPIQTSNTTPAATFRLIEASQPTLFIDEADTFLKYSEDMRGIINSGHTRDSAYVLRTVGNDFEPKRFSTWCAKALCGIGNLPETIESRSIILKMRRKMAGEHAANLRHSDPTAFDAIKRKLARWSADNAEKFSKLHPVMEGLNNRDADNFEPLMAIAMLAGGDWVSHITKAAKQLTKSDSDNRSIGVELLDACRTAFETLKVDKISSVNLIREICKDDEAPFETYNRGKPITPRQVSRWLSQYRISPKAVRFSYGVAKGYDIKQFAEAFAVYLSDTADSSLTELQTNEINSFNVTADKPVTLSDSESVTPKAISTKASNSVTDDEATLAKSLGITIEEFNKYRDLLE